MTDATAFRAFNPIDYTHLDLQVELDTLHYKVSGVAHYEAITKLGYKGEFYVHATNMEFDSVLINRQKVDFEYKNQKVYCRFPLGPTEKFTVTFYYQCKPKKGLYFIGFEDATFRSERVIFTQGQGIDNRNWFPVFDDVNNKFTTKITTNFHSSYTVISNGVLTQKTEKQGITKWVYEMNQPHSAYLVVLGVGKFVPFGWTQNQPQRIDYAYQSKLDWAKYTYYKSDSVVQYLESYLGVNYPFEGYKQFPVKDFLYGAMENSTATVFSDYYYVDSVQFLYHNYVDVNAHEAAHQWFGNLVTAESSNHHWLHESFATYFQWLYAHHVFGGETSNEFKYSAMQAAVEASKVDTFPVAHGKAGSNRHYLKGGFLLNQLKDELGEDLFKAGIQHFLKEHAYSMVDADDFIDAFYDCCGVDIRLFVQQYFQSPFEPNFRISYAANNDSVWVSVVQNSNQNELQPIYTMNLPIRMYTKNGIIDTALAVSKQRETFGFAIRKKDWLLTTINPEYSVLAEITEVKTADDWVLQFEKSSLFNELLQVITFFESSEKPLVSAKDLIAKVSTTNSGVLKSKLLVLYFNWFGFTEELAQAIKQQATVVQQSVFGSIQNKKLNPKQFKISSLADYCIELTKQGDYVLNETLLRMASSFNRDLLKVLLAETEGTKGMNPKDFEITWHLYHYLLTNSQEDLNRLLDFSSPSFDYLSRKDAIGLLIKLDKISPQLIDNLCFAASHNNRRLYAFALSQLKELKSKGYSELIEQQLVVLSDNAYINSFRIENALKKVE